MQSYDSCIENGLVYAGKDGRQYLTQTWRVLQDTEKRMMDIVRQFGLTTMSRSQIKTSQNKEENKQYLDEQKLASSIFYSFAVGVLNNNEIDEEKINNLQYAVEWLQDKEKILKNYNRESENDR